MQSTDVLYRNDKGEMCDRIVEVLFRDLFNGTYEEDVELCVSNFNIYMDAVLGVDVEIDSFEHTEPFEFIVQAVLHENINDVAKMIVGGKWRVELKQWGGKCAVENEDKSIALALSIVQTLRLRVVANFNGTNH